MLTLYIADVEMDVGMNKLSQEEAAKVLEDMKVKIEIPKAAVTQLKRNTALDMAIEALKYSEVPNSSDCISRQAAIDTEGIDEEVRCEMCRNQIKTDRGCDGNCKYDEKLYEKIMQILYERIKPLPSAQPEPCGDAVSRQYILNALAEYIEEYEELDKGEIHDPKWCAMKEAEIVVKEAPSVQSERKTGRWLIREGISDAQCSECGMYFNDVYDMENSDAFCRHCGTKMEGLKVVKRG